MKKFLLALLAVVFAVCLAGAVACSGGDAGNYHVLIFRHAEGVEYVFDTDIQSGMEVKDGVTVNFTLRIDEEAKGEPSVYVNDREVKPNADGVYSVTVVENTLVEVRGVTYYPNHAQMIFDSNGLTYTIENEGLENGMFVRRGTVINFTAKITDGYILENGLERFSVFANGKELQPDGNGVYSFTIQDKTNITCSGVVKPVRVHFNSGDTSENNYGDNLVFYFAEDGSEFTADNDIENTFIKGETLKFKVRLSVYAKQNPYDAETKTGYKVLANGYTLYPDSEGFYTASLDNDTNTIGLQGIELDDPFTFRPDGGSGTAADPFKISRPIDLWQMAMLINGGFYTEGRYFAGYYKLVNDIDMQGERLYIIGDTSDDYGYAIFCGDFNGDGHKISNYTINNIVVDQETNLPIARSYVGLFGYVTAAMGTTPAIYNLKLENFTITANNTNGSNEMSVGAFVGEGIGVSITGCSATNGKIEVTGGNISQANPMAAYAGGFIGRMMSAASIDGTINVYSGITSSYSDIDILVQSGYVESTGGLAGLIAASSDSLSSYILNSYSTGNVEGGARAGGIVGYAAPGTSVINCYSTGDVASDNPFEEGTLSDVSYNYSYAGGLVGYAGFNTVIYNSFSTSDVYAQAEAGGKYASYDLYAGHIDQGDDLEDVVSFEPILKCYGKDSGFKVTSDFIRNTLKWAEADWLIEDGMPVINMGETSKKFTISFSVDDKFGSKPDSKTITDQYKPMSSWYSDEDGIPEFKEGTGGNRSYAYFFDAEHKERVPYSFIPTDDITLYIGYANYNDVIGFYYLGGNVNVNATLELKDDGTFTFHKGALSHTSVYTYDGETIALKASALGILTELDINDELILDYYLGSYYNYGAKLEGDRLTITGGYASEVTRVVENGVPTDNLQYTGNVIYLFPEESPLNGLKAVEGFNYGSYYADNTVYTFNGNGNGEIITDGSAKPFTYTINGTNIAIVIEGGTNVTATIKDGYLATWNDTAVKSYDGFAGIWEGSYNLYKSYEFDGKAFTGEDGTWTYNGYGNTTSTGKYTVDEDGVLHDTGDAFTAKVENGVLVVTTKDNKSANYYSEGSFVGSWYFNYSKEPISVKLTGINGEGYGTADVEFMNNAGTVIHMNYSVEKKAGSQVITIYNSDQLFATLTYDSNERLLTGTMNGVEARLSAYDVFRGSWISDDSDIGDVQFNGEGMYDGKGNCGGSDLLIEIKGTLYIAGKRYTYTYNRESGEAEFTFKSTKYTLKYDESTGNVSVTAEGKESFNLTTLDDWYGVELIDSDGFVYTFDGRSNLKNGTAKAEKGDDVRNYNYTAENGKLTLTTASDTSYKGGTIDVQTKDGHSVWVFTTDGTEKILTRNTPFTGEWTIGGEPGELTIGSIYADNKAEGSYKFYGENNATEVEFTYHPDGNYITFTINNSENKGPKIIYINAFDSDSVKELSIGPENNTTGAENSVCIKKGTEDKWYGKEYKLYNFTMDEESGVTDIGDARTDGAKLIFDGLSTASYSLGRASIYIEEDGKDSRVAVYSYSQYKFSDKADEVYPRLIISGYTFLLIPCEKSGNRFTTEVEYCAYCDGQYYAVIRPDALMKLTLNDRFKRDVTYEFDGTGRKVIRRENEEITGEYSYVFLKADTENNLQTIEFTDKDGKAFNVVVDYSASYNEDWTVFFCNDLMKIKDKNNPNVTYDIVDASNIIKHNADGTQVEYTYKVDKYDYKDYLHILSIKNGDKEFKAGLDMSDDSADKWTFVEYDAMYGKVVADRLASGVNYSFDGEGHVTRIYGDVDENGDVNTPNEEFTYTLTETDDGFVCEFEDEKGAKYSVDIDSKSPNSADWTIIVYDLTVYDSDGSGYFYQLKDATTLVYGIGSSTTEYNYEIKVNKGTHRHILVLTPKNGGEQITVIFDLSSFKKDEWTAEKVTEGND